MGSAKTGAYVILPSSEMLDLLALESSRARRFVVGEDLGTVEDEVREDLADRGILSYRLLWFEETEPERYPVQALAAGHARTTSPPRGRLDRLGTSRTRDGSG